MNICACMHAQIWSEKFITFIMYNSLFSCSKKSKIAALEAKLKLLEEDSLKVDLMPDVGAASSRPTSVTYAFIEQKPRGQKGAPKQHTASHPYHRSKPTRKHWTVALSGGKSNHHCNASPFWQMEHSTHYLAFSILGYFHILTSLHIYSMVLP